MNKRAFIGRELVLLLTAILMLFVTCRNGSRIRAEGMNLLIITLDTVRADRIGAYGYGKAETPNLDELARKGILFENCYTPVPLTMPAHCSLFTGRYPLGHRVRDNGTFFLEENEVTLAEMMTQRGYETYAVIASFVLQAKFGLNQGFSEYEDSLNMDELLHNFYSEIPADVVYTKFDRWFKKRRKEKFFAWVHFYDPHAPYEPPEEYRKGDSLSDMYDGEIAYTDVWVGKIVQDLRDENLLESTLIVVVGDHGEAFGEHQEYGHSVFCYEENLKVPLVFFNPGLFPESLLVKNRVILIDILPTLFELFGMDIPSMVQGKSLVKMFDGKGEKGMRSFYIESMYGKESLGWAPLTGIIDGPYKFISLPEPELYDLKTDIREKTNLFSEKHDIARALDEKLRSCMLKYSTVSRDSRRELTAEDRNRLESLGYISSFSSGAKATLDPKKGIQSQSQFDTINSEIEKGNLDFAQEGLRRIASQNPDFKMPQYYELLAKVYEMKSDPLNVVNTWKEAVEVFPMNSQFKITLAFKLFQMGRIEEAEELGYEIVQTDEKSSRGFILLGSIEGKKNNVKKALEYFEKALNLEPNNVQLKIRLARSLVEDNQQDKALMICQEILDDETISGSQDNASILSRIGILMAEMNHMDQALQVLLKASLLDSTNPETWNYLGVAYYQKKDYDKALGAYGHAVELDSTFASAFNNMGALYLRMFLEQKNPELMTKAVGSFNQAIKNDPRLASAYNGRASAFKFSNRIGEAIQDWNTALKLQPDFADVYFNLGITYLQTGNKSEALEILRACKEKLFNRLSPSEQRRLDRLIAEASQ